MVPYCILDIAHVAYISLQHGGRWSDQWFSIPRKLANTFMRMLDYKNFDRAFCEKGKLNLGISWHSNIGFEDMVFKELANLSEAQLGVTVVPLFLPRILARDDPEDLNNLSMLSKNHLLSDIEVKCKSFMNFHNINYCKAVVVGKAPVAFLNATNASLKNSSSSTTGKNGVRKHMHQIAHMKVELTQRLS